MWKIKLDQETEEEICSMKCDWCPTEQMWEDGNVGTDDSAKLTEIATGINGWASIDVHVQEKDEPEFITVRALSYHICPECQKKHLGVNLLEKANEVEAKE